MGKCPTEPYKGQECQCAECHHAEFFCIDDYSNGGCAVCEGPVTGCDTSKATEPEEGR